MLFLSGNAYAYACTCISINMSADAAPYIRTTITLREDIYQKLKRRGGNLSEQVNEILAREFKRDHSMFGTMKRVRMDDVRDHKDRV
jgi:hypothetical protein